MKEVPWLVSISARSPTYDKIMSRIHLKLHGVAYNIWLLPHAQTAARNQNTHSVGVAGAHACQTAGWLSPCTGHSKGCSGAPPWRCELTCCRQLCFGSVDIDQKYPSQLKEALGS